MKRLLLALVCASAFVAFLAVGAAAAVKDGHQQKGPALTLAADPTTVAPGDTVTLSGQYTTGRDDRGRDVTAHGNNDQDRVQVTIAIYDGATCTMHGHQGDDRYGHGHDNTWTIWTDRHGAFSTESPALVEIGTYSFKATVETGHNGNDQFKGGWDDSAIESDCVSVTVAEPGVEPVVPVVNVVGSSYLCWNQQMVDPVAYPDAVADQMWTTGKYFEPQAIAGNVKDGTNIGAYHLVCNAPTLVATGEGLGGSGEVYPAVVMTAYHHEHCNGNDLNVYHIYK